MWFLLRECMWCILDLQQMAKGSVVNAEIASIRKKTSVSLCVRTSVCAECEFLDERYIITGRI